MIEGGGGARLLLEAGYTGRVLRQARGENFEGDLSVEVAVTSQPHFAHTAAAQRGDNFIRVQPCAGTDRHDRWSGL